MSWGFRAKENLHRLLPLECFVAVRLLAEQIEDGVVFPAGTRGVIVDRYDDGTYGVELSDPTEDVVIVKREDLEPA